MKHIGYIVTLAAILTMISATAAWAEEAGNGFKQLDRDGDGRVSQDEYRAAAVARAERQFSQADANGDGYLSPDELRAVFQHLRDQMQQRQGGK